MLILISVAVTVTIVAWFGQRLAALAFLRYRERFEYDARVQLRDFFLFLDPARLWVANLACCIVIFLFTYVFTAQWVVAMLGAMVALAAPQYALRQMRASRLRRFDSQLPDFLLACAGALRAGAGIQATLRNIVPYSPAPLSQELGLLLRQQRMGTPLADALKQLYVRMPTEATGLFVSALTIAGQTGGSLADVLEGMSGTLQARQHLLGRIRALTAQGRLQAWIMLALPAVLGLALHGLDPDAMHALWSTPTGWGVLLVIIILEATGMYFIRRIVNIPV